MNERLNKISQGVYEIEERIKTIKNDLQLLKEAIDEYEVDLDISDYTEAIARQHLRDAIRGGIIATSIYMNDVIKSAKIASKYTKEYTETYSE